MADRQRASELAAALGTTPSALVAALLLGGLADMEGRLVDDVQRQALAKLARAIGAGPPVELPYSEAKLVDQWPASETYNGTSMMDGVPQEGQPFWVRLDP